MSHSCHVSRHAARKLPLDKPPLLLWSLSCFINPKEQAYVNNHLRPKVSALIAVELAKDPVPQHYFIDQLLSHHHGLLVGDEKTLQPLGEVISSIRLPITYWWSNLRWPRCVFNRAQSYFWHARCMAACMQGQ